MPRIILKPKSPEFENKTSVKEEAKTCEMPGCRCLGSHKAPKSRTLDEYYWFCLDHVREYNNAWDFFSGMSQQEVEDQLRQSFYGDRPTWSYAQKAKVEDILHRKIWQAYGDAEDESSSDQRQKKYSGHRASQPMTPEMEALAIMGLSAPVTLEEIKARYKSLAKKYHPDLNNRDSESEELLKRINMAYTILKLAYREFQKLPERDFPS